MLLDTGKKTNEPDSAVAVGGFGNLTGTRLQMAAHSLLTGFIRSNPTESAELIVRCRCRTT